jgi:hypothetical protein
LCQFLGGELKNDALLPLPHFGDCCKVLFFAVFFLVAHSVFPFLLVGEGKKSFLPSQQREKTFFFGNARMETRCEPPKDRIEKTVTITEMEQKIFPFCAVPNDDA